MALTQDFRTFGLVRLIQLNCTEKKTGRLSIRSQDKQGCIYFENGEITHAQFGNIIGRDAVFRVLLLTEGEFTMEEGVASTLRTNQIPCAELLLEGIRLLEESHAPRGHAHQRLIADLMKIPGVLGGLIALKDGSLLHQTGTPEPERLAALVVFTALRAQSMGVRQAWGNFEKITLLLGSQRMVILDRDPDFVGLLMDPGANDARIDRSIERALKNYSMERL
ncbi:MAG: DUF4388 domain-containing protein [Acidobacteria bacterium]|nr:DUF4388 domain-containing protein [Acidobacteriota bacterium]